MPLHSMLTFKLVGWSRMYHANDYGCKETVLCKFYVLLRECFCNCISCYINVLALFVIMKLYK